MMIGTFTHYSQSVRNKQEKSNAIECGDKAE